MSDNPINTGGVAPFPFEALAPVAPTSPAPSSATPTPSQASNAESSARSWGLSDILALPEPPTAAPATESFTAAGKEWPLTVNTDASVDPDKMFALMTLIRPDQNAPITLQADVAKIHLTDPSYISGLKLLAKLATAPRLSLDEWAEFGRRITPTNPDFMGKLINFALTANRIGEQDLKEEEKQAGESGGAAA